MVSETRRLAEISYERCRRRFARDVLRLNRELEAAQVRLIDYEADRDAMIDAHEELERLREEV